MRLYAYRAAVPRISLSSARRHLEQMVRDSGSELLPFVLTARAMDDLVVVPLKDIQRALPDLILELQDDEDDEDEAIVRASLELPYVDGEGETVDDAVRELQESAAERTFSFFRDRYVARANDSKHDDRDEALGWLAVGLLTEKGWAALVVDAEARYRKGR